MPSRHLQPLLTPDPLRRIRLELAREPEYPAGNPRHGYEFAVPLAPDGRIDAETWRKHRDHCRVRRFRDDSERLGRVSRKPEGQWFFDYEPGNDADDEVGFRFGEEAFVPGEYVSVRNDDDDVHVYRVVTVDPV
ncbi:MAG: hypothetical protein DI537_26005 [Stutzerimonas stutzeri]|nr:MAG: hypothetical protein DI537_26005 [Stutzerimonas stutzeri]